MRTIVAIIGAGHAGLAMSRCLAELGLDHVVLERGEVANSWATERWDSLRLLTPNWQSRLPGYGYLGSRPDGFRTMPETVSFIRRYAELIGAPVRTATKVLSVREDDHGYRLVTDRDTWQCRAVVLANGACNIPKVPEFSAHLSSYVRSVTPFDYRNPGQLEEGGVLVVGASATGMQLADEIHRSGREVTIAVGEHVRVPRIYRGRDIQWWMEAAGVLDERFDRVDDIDRARRVPSLQLAGYDDGRMLDLNSLSRVGIRVVGKMVGLNDDTACFSGSLRNVCTLSDLKMNRLLATIDQWITGTGLDSMVEPAHRFEPTRVDPSPPLMLNFRREGIRTIVWASGYRPDYTWLHVPVLDRKGRVMHDGGVVARPGMYLMGMQFMRRRKSALIDGAGADARDLSLHLASYLDQQAGRRWTAKRSTRRTTCNQTSQDAEPLQSRHG